MTIREPTGNHLDKHNFVKKENFSISEISVTVSNMKWIASASCQPWKINSSPLVFQVSAILSCPFLRRIFESLSLIIKCCIYCLKIGIMETENQVP
jgi:hypothetical protein